MSARVITHPIEVQTLSYAEPTAPCPKCGTQCPRHDTDVRCLIDIHLTCCVLLHVTVGVYLCELCAARKNQSSKARRPRTCSFRTQVPIAFPRSRYTRRAIGKVVQTIAHDGLGVDKTVRRVQRDFCINPAPRTVWQWWRKYPVHLFDDTLPDYQDYHQQAIEHFSGVLVLDECYDKQFCVVFARDPINGTTLGYLVSDAGMDRDKLQPFLKQLKAEGVIPEVVITDASVLYPSLLKELWSSCRHQLCLFHFTRGVVEDVLQGVAEVERALPKPPKRKPGRPKKRGRPRQDKAKHERKKRLRAGRFLVVRNFQRTLQKIQRLQAKGTPRALSAAARALQKLEQEQASLARLLEENPSLKVLRAFMDDYYRLFERHQSIEEAYHKRNALLVNPDYLACPTLAKTCTKLADDALFEQLTVFLRYENADRTSNDAERTNRDHKRRQEGQHYRYRTEQSLTRSIENATVLRRLNTTPWTLQEKAATQSRHRKAA